MAIPNLAQNTHYAIHMRCPSSSGGKDWVGSITSNGEIHTFWGKTGQINQHAAKQSNRQKLDAVIAEKLAKGYVEIDEYHVNQGWQSQRNSNQPSAAAGPTTPPPPPKPKGPPINLIKQVPAVDDIAIPSTVAAVAPLAWDF